MESHATVVIPFDHRVFFVRSLNRTQFHSWFSEVAQTFDPIPGVNSWPVAEGSESDGLLARSESGVAPGYDKGGCGALGSSRIWVISFVSFQGAEGTQRPSLRLFISLTYPA